MKIFNIFAFALFGLTLANARIINENELEKPSKSSQQNSINNNNAADMYIDILKNIDYGNSTTYVIGHKSPDADTVGSAIAYADLLNKLEINAKAVVSGPINGETNYFFNLFGIKSPEILTKAEGKQFVLVDHSNYLQAIDGMKSARIVGIIDHHNVGDVLSSEPIYSRFAPVGAAASIIYLCIMNSMFQFQKKLQKLCS